MEVRPTPARKDVSLWKNEDPPPPVVRPKTAGQRRHVADQNPVLTVAEDGERGSPVLGASVDRPRRGSLRTTGLARGNNSALASILLLGGP